MPAIQFAAVLLHILAAVIWIGGMVFLGAVLIPVLRDPAMRPQAAILIQRTGRRFRNLGWACLLLLIATGVVNLERWGVDWNRFASNDLWLSTWGRILAVKLGLVAVALALSLLHDLVVGPRAVTKLREAPGSAEALRLRRLASWMGRIILLLGIGIVAAAVMLVRGLPA
jgi:putative copper resistance protein D